MTLCSHALLKTIVRRSVLMVLAYVMNASPSSVSVIDTKTQSVIATVLVGPGADNITISPDGKLAYVTFTRNVISGVSVIDTKTHSVIATIQVGVMPVDIGN
ncbi:YncE family protein [Bacillus sp. SCS-151]|uniref:YncE family protein n=1 Tax=Nanhaiella sioensis TaxID=3115293 RepID=UPI003979271D